ncbi:transposase family protein [Gordonia sp. Z-3]|uniref:transposase family protein n=1 Tax=Gordonia sp. Z-3 TaxID=3115408 RepID=UPI003FA56368
MVDATSSLLLGLEGLEVAAVSRWDGTRVVDVVTADPAAARCPGCRTISTSVKDHAVTRPRDIRYGDDPILLRWNKTRYRCVNPGCERATGRSPITGPVRSRASSYLQLISRSRNPRGDAGGCSQQRTRPGCGSPVPSGGVGGCGRL